MDFKRDFTVKTMVIDDCADVARIHTQSWQVAYQGILDQSILDNLSIQKREQSWRQGFSAQPELIRLVILDHEHIIGFAIGLKNRDNEPREIEGELYALYIDPHYFRSGAGSSLFQAFKEKLIRKGIRNFCVWVLKENKNSRLFYEKMGGVLSSSHKNFEVGDKKYAEVCYLYSKI